MSGRCSVVACCEGGHADCLTTTLTEGQRELGVALIIKKNGFQKMADHSSGCKHYHPICICAVTFLSPLDLFQNPQM